MPDASFLSSDLFLLTLTVGLYCLGGAIYRRTRLPLLHPVLLTFVAEMKKTYIRNWTNM